MLLTMVLAGAMIAPPDAPGPWRILREGASGSIAVQLGERPPRAGDFGTASVLMTYAAPRPNRSGGTYRQTWIELSIECPHQDDAGHYGDVWNLIAEPATPLPKGDIPPPIAVRAFDDDYLGPIALAICNGEAASGPAIEGDWPTVLAALVTRSDAR